MKYSMYAMMAAMAINVSAAAEDNFGGFYAGVAGDMSFANTKTDMRHAAFDGQDVETRGWQSKTAKKKAGGAGLFVGYNKVLGSSWVWGTQLGIQKDFDRKKSAQFILGDPDVLNFGQYTYNWSLTRKFTMSLSQKIGYLVRENCLVYFKAGVLNTRFKIAQDNTYAADPLVNPRWVAHGNEKKAVSAWGAELGLGVEYALNQDWNLGIEYSYQMYKGVKHNFMTTPAGNALQTKMKPCYNRVAVALSYKF